MKLVRSLSATLLAISLGLGLFALQIAAAQGFGRDRGYYSGGPNVPSEFYWSRLQYTSSYASGSSFGFRRFCGGWSRIIPRPTTIA